MCIRDSFNGDGCRDTKDLALMVPHWNSPPNPNYDPLYDVDEDGDVDTRDLMLVAAVWNTTCTGDPCP